MRCLGKILVFLFFALVLYRVLWQPSELRHPPGVLVAAQPKQIAVAPFSLGEISGFQISAVALYEITARVLHTKRYRFGVQSSLVPFDVAAGWGPMSDQAVLDRLAIYQSNRFFFFEWQGTPPMSPKVLGEHSANMHLIAADASVAAGIQSLKSGEIVAMTGYLVNAIGPAGLHWNTSLSRTDSGNGACELFYVSTLNKIEK